MHERQLSYATTPLRMHTSSHRRKLASREQVQITHRSRLADASASQALFIRSLLAVAPKKESAAGDFERQTSADRGTVRSGTRGGRGGGGGHLGCLLAAGRTPGRSTPRLRTRYGCAKQRSGESTENASDEVFEVDIAAQFGTRTRGDDRKVHFRIACSDIDSKRKSGPQKPQVRPSPRLVPTFLETAIRFDWRTHDPRKQCTQQARLRGTRSHNKMMIDSTYVFMGRTPEQ